MEIKNINTTIEQLGVETVIYSLPATITNTDGTTTIPKGIVKNIFVINNTEDNLRLDFSIILHATNDTNRREIALFKALPLSADDTILLTDGTELFLQPDTQLVLKVYKEETITSTTTDTTTNVSVLVQVVEI